MTSKSRLPDRVHVVRPPSDEFASQPLQSMGDHTREIVRALAQINDKLKRSEVERIEVLRELKETRSALAELEDKTEQTEKAYLTLEHKVKNRDTIESEMTARQARFEKSLKLTEEKLVKAVAGQALLDQKIQDSETKSLALIERIDESVAQQTRLDRRIEGISQDKARMLRKVERLEEVVAETQEALKAKAMILLTDQSVAAQGNPALQAPAWYNANNQNDNDRATLPWWKSPLRMQALGTASMVVAALLTGWMINHVQQPDVPQIAVLDSGALAKLNADKTGWEPLNIENSDKAAEQDSLPSFFEDTEKSVDAVLASPEADEAPATDKVDPVAAIPEEEEPFDYTNDEQLMKALEENPDALAENLNAIEPGITEALELDETQEKATQAPTPVIQQASIPEKTEAIAPVEKSEATPVPTQESALKANDDLTQDADVAASIKSETGAQPLSKRAVRDESLPPLLKEYEDQAIKGVPGAQHDLAAIYTAGRGGVPQNFEKAAFWFREAAGNGVANAQYNLGVLYHQGLGVKQDLEKALYWYREASNSNHPEAQYNLGIAYIEGIGTAYNPQQAAKFFENAANNGIMEAAYNLGLIHENGLLGKPDTNEALYWYKKASDEGSVEAKSALTQLSKKLQIGPEDIDKLVEQKKPQQKTESKKSSSDKQSSVQTDDQSGVQNASFSDQSAITAQIQEKLNVLGLYPGPADGVMGPKTADAIRSYQSENGLGVTGKPSQDVLLHMMSQGL